MRGRGRRVDFSIYGRALPYLVRNPSILALPLLAAVLDMLLSYWSGAFTDPLGGYGAGIFQMIVQIIYLFAFGVAVIQANNIARGYRTKFDDAWEDGRRKAGGIIIAAIGFQFIGYVGTYVGQLLNNEIIAWVLRLAAYFFLILTIPAAAIGGLPGGLAISASFRAVRANIVPCIVLAVAFALLWIALPIAFSLFAGPHLSLFAGEITLAAIRALVLGYLAFPFATTYDDIAFKLF